jgi:hypothetical protein
MLVLSELRFTVIPPVGADAERVKRIVVELLAATVTPGTVTVAVTWTCWVAVV